MVTKVSYSEDPAWVLAEAKPFLASDPIRHNLILSLLHARVANPEPGRYWVAKEGDKAVGVIFQSPLNYPAVITPMDTGIILPVVCPPK